MRVAATAGREEGERLGRWWAGYTRWAGLGVAVNRQTVEPPCITYYGIGRKGGEGEGGVSPARRYRNCRVVTVTEMCCPALAVRTQYTCAHNTHMSTHMHTLDHITL